MTLQQENNIQILKPDYVNVKTEDTKFQALNIVQNVTIVVKLVLDLKIHRLH